MTFVGNAKQHGNRILKYIEYVELEHFGYLCGDFPLIEYFYTMNIFIDDLNACCQLF